MQSLHEALDWLYQQKKLKKREDLSRIKNCIELLKIQISYPVIHIAGTNGKGSTASYLNRMLMLSGKKVGLFVSPFVICFNERIEINQEYISDEDILLYIDKLQKFQADYQRNYEDTIPFFELTLLMALLYFQEQKIDILILECGIGGLLDATNAIEKKVCVITNIGYDHMAQLGNTLEDIAFHKLGITRPGVPCFTTVDEELLLYFKDYAKQHDVPLYWLTPEIKHIDIRDRGTKFMFRKDTFQTSLDGVYQAYNAALAIAVMQYLNPNQSVELLKEAIKTTSWPGRFEYITPQIILDGAHNLPGIQALSHSLHLKYPHKKIKIVFTALKDKAIDSMLEALDSVVDSYYFTTIEDKRSSTLDTFHTKKKYVLYEDYREAIKKARENLKTEEILVITGSLHFISQVRKFLRS